MGYDWFNKDMHQDLDQSEHSEKKTAHRLNQVQNSVQSSDGSRDFFPRFFGGYMLLHTSSCISRCFSWSVASSTLSTTKCSSLLVASWACLWSLSCERSNWLFSSSTFREYCWIWNKKIQQKIGKKN